MEVVQSKKNLHLLLKRRLISVLCMRYICGHLESVMIFPLGNSLFGTVKLTTDPDPDKDKYYGYGTGFDTRGSSQLSNSSGFGKNVITFGANMRSSMHVDNDKKRYLNP